MVFTWLLCQATGMAAAPLALCCDAATAPAGSGEDSCCQGLLPGQVCPMHHTRPSTSTCKMRGACGRSDSALFSLSGGIGVTPPPTSAVTPFAPRELVSPATVSLVARVRSPEAPPPRV